MKNHASNDVQKTPEPQPEPLKRDSKGRVTNRNWPALRAEYETGSLTLRQFASLHSLSASTLMQRAARDHWQRREIANKNLVSAASIEAAIDARAQAKIKNELAPYIEREKEKITRRGVRLSSRGLSRLEKLWRKVQPESARVEADAARALETFVRVARQSLGMNDGAPIAGPLSPILISHSAVQITSPAASPGQS